MKLSFFTELVKRWNEESPAFFVKVQNIALVIIAIGAAIAGLPAIVSQYIPLEINLTVLATIGGIVGGVGSAIGAIAKLAVQKPENLK